jgi:hypothetical protein
MLKQPGDVKRRVQSASIIALTNTELIETQKPHLCGVGFLFEA